MKRLWKRFKHWLIKKLGGYVKADQELVVDRYGVYPMTVVAQSRIHLEDYRRAYNTFKMGNALIKDMECQIGHMLGSELIKQGLVTYSVCKDCVDLDYLIRGIIQVIPPKGRQYTDLGYVLRGEANET